MISKMNSHGKKDAAHWFKHMILLTESPIAESGEFPKLKNPVKQVQFISRLLQKNGASMEVNNCNEKDNEKTADYRNKGNELYRSAGSESASVEIAEMYTKSITYAKPKSKELALAYENRSALLFTLKFYNECLADIQRSLQNGYPDDMKAKLYARRVKCFVQLNKSKVEIEEAINETKKWFSKMDKNASGSGEIEKLFSDEYPTVVPKDQSTEKKLEKIILETPNDNPEIPGASSAIQISYSHEYGRHLTATRDIRAGEILVVQKMYCAMLPLERWHRYCENCLKETMSGIPCDYCVNVIYCSEKCRSESWSDHHEIECQVLSALLAIKCEKSAALITLRVTIKALKEAGSFAKLKKMIKKLDSASDRRTKGFTGKVFDSTKYASVCTGARTKGMDEKKEVFVSAVHFTFITYMLATRSNMFGKKLIGSYRMFEENTNVAFVAELLMRHFEIVKATVGAPTIRDTSTQVEGITPIVGLFNHSCDPNIGSLFGTAVSCFSLRPIKKGEMLCDCYHGFMYTTFTKSVRQEHLQAQWRFTCNCIACEEDWPKLSELRSLCELSPTLYNSKGVELVKDAIVEFEKRVEGKDVYQAATYVELHEIIVRIVELICNHVSAPSKERANFQKVLRTCYVTAVEYA